MSGTDQQGSIGLIVACCVLSVCILAVDLAIPLGVAGGVPYIAVVLLSLRSPQRGFTILVAITGSVLTILGFFLSPSGGEMWKVLFNRALALFAIWVTAFLSLQRKRIEEQREQLSREREEAFADVKVLRGLLPICASCKRIRDDRGYWSAIETYIDDHSEAEFSHGICPECTQILYPGLDFDKKSASEI